MFVYLRRIQYHIYHICIQSIDIDSAALSEEDPENIAIKDIIFFEIDSVDNLLLDYACKILY